MKATILNPVSDKGPNKLDSNGSCISMDFPSKWGVRAWGLFSGEDTNIYQAYYVTEFLLNASYTFSHLKQSQGAIFTISQKI